MEKLEKSTWDGGNMLAQQIENNMEEKEKKYYEEYNKLISQFSKTQSFVELDLTKGYTPPKTLYVEVRAQDDFQIKEKNGRVQNIRKNETYLLKYSDIEIYIRSNHFDINE